MGNSRKGFTLVELVVGVTVMIVVTLVATISLDSAKQKPKNEAEKIAAYLSGLAQKADRIRMKLVIELADSKIKATWLNDKGESKDYEPDFVLNNDCSYYTHFNPDNHNKTDVKELTYSRITYPRGAKIFATASLSGKYDSGTTYNYSTNKKGHRYVRITANNAANHYVVITGNDIVQ